MAVVPRYRTVGLYTMLPQSREWSAVWWEVTTVRRLCLLHCSTMASVRDDDAHQMGCAGRVYGWTGTAWLRSNPGCPCRDTTGFSPRPKLETCVPRGLAVRDESLLGLFTEMCEPAVQVHAWLCVMLSVVGYVLYI